MIMTTDKTIKILVIAGMISMVPFITFAKESLTGKFVGLINLPNYEETTKITKSEEENIKADLIVFKANNKYYRILNMPMIEKEKFIGKSAKVTGDVNNEHYTIGAEEIKIKKRTRYVKIWSDEEKIARNKWREWNQKQYESGYTPDGTGG